MQLRTATCGFHASYHTSLGHSAAAETNPQYPKHSANGCCQPKGSKREIEKMLLHLKFLVLQMGGIRSRVAGQSHSSQHTSAFPHQRNLKTRLQRSDGSFLTQYSSASLKPQANTLHSRSAASMRMGQIPSSSPVLTELRAAERSGRGWYLSHMHRQRLQPATAPSARFKPQYLQG